MGFLTSLFGGSDNAVATVLLALGIVLVLIVLGVWALKLLLNATGNAARGRNRRLSVIDTVPVDQKRHLVLIRRDNIEHLIMTGGPDDLVVETNIVPPPEPAPIARPKRQPAIVARPVPERAEARGDMPKPAEPATPAGTPPESPATTGSGSFSRLLNIGQTVTEKRPVSIRHTGLLRPAGRVEPALHPQPSAADAAKDKHAPDDSVKTGPLRAGEESARDGDADGNGGDIASDNGTQTKAGAAS